MQNIFTEIFKIFFKLLIYMKLQTLKNRVEYMIEMLGFKSVAAFERHLGWGGGSVGSLKDTLTEKRIQSLKKAFPKVNIDFLLNGSGNLYVQQKSAIEDGYLFIDYPSAAETADEDETIKKKIERIIEGLKVDKLVKNQAEFAERCGYKNSFFSQIINQHIKMPKDFAEKVSAALQYYQCNADISFLTPKPEQTNNTNNSQDEMLSVGTQFNSEILSLLKNEFAEKSFQIREILSQNRMLIEGYNSLLDILKQKKNVQ